MHRSALTAQCLPIFGSVAIKWGSEKGGRQSSMALSTHDFSWFANLRSSGEDRKMALCEKPNTTPAPRVPIENQKAPTPTSQQRRLLRLLQHGDLIWEIAEDPRHRTVYDEKRGCSRRLTTAVA